MSRSRLTKELREASKTPADLGIRLSANEANINDWTAQIRGPEGTVYAGAMFQLLIKVPQQYPLAPPEVRFKTKIFHPNVHFKTGEICLDILKEAWTPAWTLLSVCQAIVALLGTPAADSPLNCDAGNLLRAGDTRAYNSLARMYIKEAAHQVHPQAEVTLQNLQT